MNIKKLMKNKLMSRAGESIGETLVALLISALALTMLAGAISSSFNIIKASRTRLNNYYDQANKLADFSGASSKTIQIDGQSLTVSYIKNSSFSGTSVIAYKPE